MPQVQESPVRVTMLQLAIRLLVPQVCLNLNG